MSVLIICAPFSTKYYVAPQIGPYRLQFHLQARGIECDLFDPEIDNFNNFILQHKTSYDIIGISGIHAEMETCIRLVADFAGQQQKLPLIVAGGVAPTNNYQQWLQAGFDAILLGYAENTLVDLHKKLQLSGNKENLFHALHTIKGIAYQKGLVTIKQSSEKLEEHFFKQITYDNAMSMKIPYQKYWDFNKKIVRGLGTKNNSFTVRTVRIFTASQCPNKCGYCSAKFLSAAQDCHAKIFSLSPLQIINLIKRNVEIYNPELIFFNDDEFLFNTKRTQELCNYIIHEKTKGTLPISLKFECQSRVIDFFTHKKINISLINILKKAGFSRISVGAETFSKRLLSTPIMNKAQYTYEDILTLIGAFQKVSLLLQINLMLFIPETTKEDILLSISHVHKLMQSGIPINLNLKIMADPGASALTDKNYSYTTKKIVSCLNNVEFKISEYFIPHTPIVQNYFANIDPHIACETRIVLQKLGLQKERLMNTYRAGILCLALLKMLGETQMYTDMLCTIEKISSQ